MRATTTFGDFDPLLERLVANAPKFDSLPAWYLATDAGKTAVDEAEAQHVGTRAGLVKQLDDHRRERDKKLTPIERELPAARQRLAAAEVALKSARERVRDLEGGLHAARVGHDTRRDHVLSDLRTSADPLIVGFVNELRDEWERTRQTSPDWTEFGKQNAHGDRPRVNNRLSIVARLDSIRQAIEKSEALKLRPLTRAQTIEALGEIHAGIAEVVSPETFLPRDHETATIVPFRAVREAVDRASVWLQRYGQAR